MKDDDILKNYKTLDSEASEGLYDLVFLGIMLILLKGVPKKFKAIIKF